MRIRLILEDFPWPLDSGLHIRQYHILKSLAGIGDVDLITIPRYCKDIPRNISDMCKDIFVQRYSRNMWNRKWKHSRIMKPLRELIGNPYARPTIPTILLNREVIQGNCSGG